jgi:hypothetical protein
MADTLRSLTDQEKRALELLDGAPDAFTGMAAAARETGLSHEQVREANSLRAARRRTNGGVTVTPFIEDRETPAGVPVVDVPLPDPADDSADEPEGAVAVEQLLRRADEIGSVRAHHLADRILRDVEDLRETLAEDEVTFAARRRRDVLLAQRAELDERLAEVNAVLRPPPPSKTRPGGIVKKSAKKRPAGRRRAAAGNALLYSQEIREWAKANGFEVGEKGRLRNDVIAAYQSAQAVEVTSGSADS